MSRPPNIAKGTPGKVLFAFALLVCLVAWSAFSDRMDRGELEEFDYPTGIADEEFAPVRPAGDPVGEIGGLPLFAGNGEPIGRRDAFMVKYAREDADRFFLYRDTPEGDDTGALPPLYVKVARNKYLPLATKPSPPGPDGESS